MALRLHLGLSSMHRTITVFASEGEKHLCVFSVLYDNTYVERSFDPCFQKALLIVFSRKRLMYVLRTVSNIRRSAPNDKERQTQNRIAVDSASLEEHNKAPHC